MGMTIDDCVKELLLNKEDDTYVLTKETTDFAIETMRKYQKLENYMEKLEKNGQYGTLRKLTIALGEVKDGND